LFDHGGEVDAVFPSIPGIPDALVRATDAVVRNGGGREPLTRLYGSVSEALRGARVRGEVSWPLSVPLIGLLQAQGERDAARELAGLQSRGQDSVGE